MLLYRGGDKRVAFMTMATFLGVNGYELETTDEDVVATIVALAAGSRTKTELAAWVRTHLRRQTRRP